MSIVDRLLAMIEKTAPPYMVSVTPLPQPNRSEVHIVCDQALNEIFRLEREVNEMHLTEIRELGT